MNTLHPQSEQELRDAEFFLLAEQIHRDYLEFIKAIVLPDLNENHNIKLREIRILACIHAGKGPMSSSNVAEMMRLDPATVARALIILVGGGLVTTVENFKDGRSRIIELTDKGLIVVEEYNRALANGIEKAKNEGGIVMNEDEEMRFVEHMTGVRNRASRLAKIVKRLIRARPR